MQIILKGKNMEVPAKVHDHATSKLAGLEKFIPHKDSQEVLAEVELGRRSRRHKKGDVYRAEINLMIDGILHRSVSKKSDLMEAFDSLCPPTAQRFHCHVFSQSTRSRHQGGSWSCAYRVYCKSQWGLHAHVVHPTRRQAAGELAGIWDHK